MRIFFLLIAMSLFLGCISLGEKIEQNNTTVSNMTNETNTTPPLPPKPSPWTRFNSTEFSFEYPAEMSVQQSSSGKSGIFSGTHEENGQTYEVMVVTHLDTIATYGVNKDEIFKDNPNKAASDLLEQDRVSDPAGILDQAFEMGEITTFSIERAGYGARSDFKIKFGSGGKTYSGHALNIYVPERSLHVKVRIFTLDEEKAEDIMENFLLTFRLE